MYMMSRLVLVRPLIKTCQFEAFANALNRATRHGSANLRQGNWHDKDRDAVRVERVNPMALYIPQLNQTVAKEFQNCCSSLDGTRGTS